MKQIISLLLLVFLIGCGTGDDNDKIPNTTPGGGDTIISSSGYKYVFHYKDTTICVDSTIVTIDTIPPVKPPDVPPILPTTIKFGLMQASDDKAATKKLMQAAGINLIRLPLYFDRNTQGNVIDDFLQSGFEVQINFNYKNTATPVPFPKDTAFIRRQAKAFFSYYQKWLKQIPFIVCENEWDNQHYRDWKNTTIQDYITELKIVVDEGHKYGFKIAAGGITGNTLGRWAYHQLSKDSAAWWKSKYFVGDKNANYQPMLKLVNDFTRLIKDVPVDYLNTHWYNNNSRCSGGYPHAYNLYAKACGKPNTPRVNNEFGFRGGSLEVWQCTIQEMKDAGIVYAIAWSGDGSSPAERLTAEMLNELK